MKLRAEETARGMYRGQGRAFQAQGIVFKGWVKSLVSFRTEKKPTVTAVQRGTQGSDDSELCRSRQGVIPSAETIFLKFEEEQI